MNSWSRISVPWVTVLCAIGLAAEPAEDYIRVYRRLQQADELLRVGRLAEAFEDYLLVREALVGIQGRHPDWNPPVIEFRLRYVDERLNSTPLREPKPNTASAPPAEVLQLEQRVRELDLDREVLRARLEEALAARPAAVDPQELTRAEAKIKAQQKEIEVMRARLARAETASGEKDRVQNRGEANPTLVKAHKPLGLVEENSAMAVREEGGVKVWIGRESNAEFNPTPSGVAITLPVSRQPLNAQTDGNRNRIESLLTEQQVLQSRLREISEQCDNDRSARTALSRELVEARRSAETLKSENRAVREELKEVLRQLELVRLAPLRPTPVRPDAAEVRRLRAEREDLQVRLDGAMRELLERGLASGISEPAPGTDELLRLQSRVRTLEARRVSFPPATLALLKSPGIRSAGSAGVWSGAVVSTAGARGASLAVSSKSAGSNQVGQPVRTRPAAPAEASDWSRDAIELITHRRFAEAETILRRAEPRAQRDPHRLLLLGLTQYYQDKLDESLGTLSESAALDPQNSETFGFLGLALSRKGLRQPAEAAFWRAVRIAPGNGEAHFNLAVLYVAQDPPILELARYHYEQATAAGLPRDPDLERQLGGDSVVP